MHMGVLAGPTEASAQWLPCECFLSGTHLHAPGHSMASGCSSQQATEQAPRCPGGAGKDEPELGRAE